MLVLCSHILDAVIAFAALLLWNDHITLVTALRDKLTGSFVLSKVLLIQLFLAAKVCALDSRIFAIKHVALQVEIADDLLAAFFRVLTAGFDHGELLLQERVRVYQVERSRAAIRTDNVVFPLDQLREVVIDALFAEAFAALVALAWIYHHVLAQDAVQ